MKIVRLTAENVKRLKAVEITPGGNVVTITGRNAQGKTSVLDAIWLALGGGAASKTTAKPIRDGETKASVTLDLGDLTVTRTWTEKGTSLKVANADGATYGSPQKVLDELVGRLSFDPLAFTRLSAREQREALLSLVDLDVDLDDIAAQRAAAFAERTEIGRQGKALGEVTVDNALPAEETSASEIIAQIREIEAANRARDAADQEVQHWADECFRTSEEIARLSKLLEDQAKAHADAQRRRVEFPEPRSTAALEAQLATIEETNAAIRANNVAREQAARKAELRGQYAELTEQIESLDAKKATALASAKFPVPGLGFDDSGVTFQGVPFSQASSAEQIRVSLAMAMASNPKLRVIRILDGSLLDADNLALISEMAADGDYQVWIERVSDPTETAVVIEDGQVAS